MQNRWLRHSWKGLWGGLVLLGLVLQAPQGPAASLSAAYLPLVASGASDGLVTIWTSDSSNYLRQAFRPGEVIQFNASGFNQSEEMAAAELTWSLEGPCGNRTIASGSFQLPPGSWAFSQSALAPDCPSFHKYSLEMYLDNKTAALSVPLLVSPSSQVLASVEQAFDKCNIPSLKDMQTWWTSSPYHSINLYIGGSARACANLELDAFWVFNASQMGWSFIPTWVGPQAPCSTLSKKMSSDPATAYLEGRTEANAAAATVLRLGLFDENVIYYDIEAFHGKSGATQQCREAVKSFLRGWVERLHELAIEAGAYGAPCSSYMNDWATITPMPDDVWIAAWNAQTYNPNATVWGVSCVSDSLWANQQRIRQYAGDHVETWGEISMIIDSNVAGGPVSALPLTIGSTIIPKEAGSVAFPPGTMTQAEQVAEEQNWALAGQTRFWTEDGGSQWRRVNTDATQPVAVLAAHFLDERLGWLVTRGQESGSLAVQRTMDGGITWQDFSLDLPAALEAEVQPLAVNFAGEQLGWITLKLSSSSNFSQGMLLRTSDGGQTWQELPLPVAAPVAFATPQRGWVAGGASGTEIYQTLDGGQTWKPLQIGNATADPATPAYPALPVFADAHQGLLPVTIAEPQASRLEVHATQDGGATWQLAATIPLESQLVPPGAISLEEAGPGRWSLFAPGEAQLHVLGASGKVVESIRLDNAPQGVVELKLAASGALQARVEQGECWGTKPRPGEAAPPLEQAFRCVYSSALLASDDNGHTWREITPAAGMP